LDKLVPKQEMQQKIYGILESPLARKKANRKSRVSLSGLQLYFLSPTQRRKSQKRRTRRKIDRGGKAMKMWKNGRAYKGSIACIILGNGVKIVGFYVKTIDETMILCPVQSNKKEREILIPKIEITEAYVLVRRPKK
jgi:hypothetical protein